MKKLGFLFWITVLALLAAPLGMASAAGLTAPGAGPVAQQTAPQTITVQMGAQNNSGESGTATITDAGNGQIMVMVNLNNGASTPQPAHIHKGTCTNLDPVPFKPLNDVINGKSDTTVGMSIADLAKGGYAINVHKSASEIATYVSCGDIQVQTNPQVPGTPGSQPGGVPAPFTAVTVQMHAQNGSGEDGTAVITVSGQDQVNVMITLSNGTTTPQPAHIHKGTCANLDPTPAYPLNNVIEGKSSTTVNAGIGDLAMQGYAINVHKSATEISTYVSCGDITVAGASGGHGAPGAGQPGGSTGGTTGGSTGGQTGGTTGGSTGGQTGGSPGMPTTGNGQEPWVLFGVLLLALSFIGTGLFYVRRRA